MIQGLWSLRRPRELDGSPDVAVDVQVAAHVRLADLQLVKRLDGPETLAIADLELELGYPRPQLDRVAAGEPHAEGDGDAPHRGPDQLGQAPFSACAGDRLRTTALVFLEQGLHGHLLVSNSTARRPRRTPSYESPRTMWSARARSHAILHLPERLEGPGEIPGRFHLLSFVPK